MRGRVSLRAVAMVGMGLLVISTEVFAGGPVCPPPVYAPPPLCVPPMCGPGPIGPPPVCAPQAVCPPPTCGPRPCVPRCRVNPIARVLGTTCALIAGVVAIPFKVVDCLLTPFYEPVCCPGPVVASGPPPAYGPVGVSLPWQAPPGGIGPPGFRPVPPRRGAPKRFAPFHAKGHDADRLIAVKGGGVFGNYW